MLDVLRWFNDSGFPLAIFVLIFAWIWTRHRLDLSDLPRDVTITVRHEHYTYSDSNDEEPRP